jgi:NHLM bacteriocin system ABC transporter peptidase/ATP-binding protein
LESKETNRTNPAEKITFRSRRVNTPTLLQMEAVECGAAALGIVLSYFGRVVALEELRVKCGVSRDGSKASNILKAARRFGMNGAGYKKEISDLESIPLPFIIFWNFNHFLVVEGFKKDRVFLNDPATGRRTVNVEEFNQSFTGIVLVVEPGPDFEKGGKKRSVKEALWFRLSGSKMALIFVVLVGLGLVIPGLVIPVFTRVFVDNILIGHMTDWARPLIVAMVITAILRALLTSLQQRYLMRLETKLALSTSSKFLWHVLRLPIEFFTQRFGGEIGARVMINDRIAVLLSGELATTLISIVTLLFFVIVMFQYDVLLTMVSLLIAGLNIVALQYVSRKRTDANQKLMQDRGTMQGTAMAGLMSIETLKGSGGESDFFTRWSGYMAKVMNGQQEFGYQTGLLSTVPPFLLSLNTLAILGVGSLRVLDGHLTIGMLMAYQFLMLSFMEPIGRLLSLGSVLQEMEGGLAKLDDVLRYKTDEALETREVSKEIDEESIKLNGYLELKNITFGYSLLDPPLIENFNLTLKPGERVALIGSSGSGKSTVSKLVSGLYEPWQGEILFDGKPRKEIPRTTMANSLAMVDQDVFLFEGTIRENLTLWDSTVPETNIVQSGKDAAIQDEIAARTRGYDAVVEEAGRNFSGGQRQRLEIARALTGTPRILILDEATSALDAVTEKMVDDALRRRGCTCLIVAHRLSTIRDCDEIIVLEKGKVVQRGTHEQMKNVDGPYARLIAT